MVLPACESESCLFCVTRITNQQYNRVQVPPSQIPDEGICSASDSGIDPCEYPNNPEYCPKRGNQDFCGAGWTKQF